MRSRKIFYIISHVNKSSAFEWTALALKDSFDLTFVLLNPFHSTLETFLRSNGINVIRIHYDNKYNQPEVFLKLCWLFISQRPVIVHTHLFDATLAGLIAAWIVGIRKRIYTRHNSTFHHDYFPKGVKYDLLANRLATKIISVSQATDHALIDLEHAVPDRVIKIPHGFDLAAFDIVSSDRIDIVRTRWSIQSGWPVIGVIARHIEWKGIQYIVPAFQKLLSTYPDAQLVLASAAGPFRHELEEILGRLPSDRVVQIPFEEDVAALYKLFDLFVHTPVDPYCEAFGQTYVEALAAGIPSIFTMSGIAAEFIVHNRNAIVVDFKNAEGIYQALLKLCADDKLRGELKRNGRHDVISRFGLTNMITALSHLYETA